MTTKSGFSQQNLVHYVQHCTASGRKLSITVISSLKTILIKAFSHFVRVRSLPCTI